MELAEYIRSTGISQAEMASRIGVTQGMVWQWLNGRRPVSAELCSRIESSTNGQVRRWDLRPHDWHRIWPELISHPDAPAIPAETKETA